MGNFGFKEEGTLYDKKTYWTLSNECCIPKSTKYVKLFTFSKNFYIIAKDDFSLNWMNKQKRKYELKS